MKFLLYLFAGVLFLASCGYSPPVGDAGPDQTVTLGATVTLDGTNSISKNVKAPTYYWTITEAPAGSSATLDNANAPQPTFTPDLVGIYIVQLIINNGDKNSEPVQVTITVLPVGTTLPPVTIGTDLSGDVSLYELVAIENSRTATYVDFSVQYTIENVGIDLVNVGFFIYGIDAQDLVVFTREITTTIGASVQQIGTVSYGEALTIAEYESIVSWDVDPITIY